MVATVLLVRRSRVSQCLPELNRPDKEKPEAAKIGRHQGGGVVEEYDSVHRPLILHVIARAERQPAREMAKPPGKRQASFGITERRRSQF